MTREIEIDGECRVLPGWTLGDPPVCDKGIPSCVEKHPVRFAGSHCRRHDGPGGHHICPARNTVGMACTNYEGKYRGSDH